MIVAIDHVQVAAPPGREADARAFYGGLLGLRELEKPEPLGERGGVWFQVGADHQLHVGVEEEFRPARKAHPCFQVLDLHALRARLESAGVETRPDESLPGVERFFVADPFGNRVELTARR